MKIERCLGFLRIRHPHKRLLRVQKQLAKQDLLIVDELGSERLTGALLDRLTHHVHILELNGDSYRLEHSKTTRHHAADPAS